MKALSERLKAWLSDSNRIAQVGTTNGPRQGIRPVQIFHHLCKRAGLSIRNCISRYHQPSDWWTVWSGIPADLDPRRRQARRFPRPEAVAHPACFLALFRTDYTSFCSIIWA